MNKNGEIKKQYYAMLNVFLIYCFCLGLGEIEEPPLKKKGWCFFTFGKKNFSYGNVKLFN